MAAPVEILFFRWVTLTEQKWVSFRERRSSDRSPNKLKWVFQQPASLARLSQKRSLFSHAAGLLSDGNARSVLDERSVGIQRPSSNASTQACWSRVRSGAGTTVAGRPRCFPRTRTDVASIPDRVFIMACADFWLPRARRAKLTSSRPMTVAKVCNRSELSAH